VQSWRLRRIYQQLVVVAVAVFGWQERLVVAIQRDFSDDSLGWLLQISAVAILRAYGLNELPGVVD
jgi:hypothetical protein